MNDLYIMYRPSCNNNNDDNVEEYLKRFSIHMKGERLIDSSDLVATFPPVRRVFILCTLIPRLHCESTQSEY